MEPRTYFTAIARGWLIIVIAAILGGLAGLGLSSARSTSYEARASGILAVESVENGSDLWQTSNAAVTLASSYADLVKTPMVTDRVAAAVEGVSSGQAASSLSASAPLESVTINITASNADAERAAAIANAAATGLQEAVAEVAPKTAEGAPAVTLHITQQASAPNSPSGLSSTLLIGIGVVGGLLLGVVIALLRAPSPTASTTVREVETVER